MVTSRRRMRSESGLSGSDQSAVTPYWGLPPPCLGRVDVKVKSAVTVWPAMTVTVCILLEKNLAEAATCRRPDGTLESVKFPEISVRVVINSDGSTIASTSAPSIESPLSESVTDPVMLPGMALTRAKSTVTVVSGFTATVTGLLSSKSASAART